MVAQVRQAGRLNFLVSLFEALLLRVSFKGLFHKM